MTTTDQSRQLMMQYFEAISMDKTVQNLDRFVADAQLKDFLITFEQGLPGYSLVPQHIVASKNKVAARFRLKGRHLGILYGFAPTDRDINIVGVILCELENCKIIRHSLQLDTASLMQQLAAVPAEMAHR